MALKHISRRGLLLVLSSPSGAGKTTITRRLLESDENLSISISATTRAKRPDEIDGRDYDFVTPERFARMREHDEFVESAEVFGHWYGTPREPVLAALAAGRDMIFDIDWQGAEQLAKTIPDDVVRVFILPPSVAELESRLKRRAQDSDAVVAARMARAADEMAHHDVYDYVLVNHALDQAVEDARAVLHAERCRRERLTGLSSFVDGLIGR
jgi:guanylate kinase